VSDTPNIDDLRARLRRLDDLLADPHPGLSTWCQAYARASKHLLQFFLGEGPKIISDDVTKEPA
jgi:hypothetical protein